MAHFVYTGLKANLPEVRENAFIFVRTQERFTLVQISLPKQFVHTLVKTGNSCHWCFVC